MKLFTLVFFFLVSLSAADWPSFRGSQSNSGSTDDELVAEPQLAWKFTTGGALKGTAVVQGNLVYIGSEDQNVYCLNLQDGSKVWEQKADDMIESSPLILDGDVIIGTVNGELYRFNGKTGEKIWMYKAEDRFAGAANWFEENGEKVIVTGNYDNSVHAISFKDGKEKWAFDTENYINGTPAIANGKIAFGGCDNSIYVLGFDGKLIREIDLGSYIAGSVAIEGNQAYIGHYENKYFRVDLEEGKVVWEFSRSTFPFFASAAIGKEAIYFGGRDRRVYSLNKESGKENWSFKTKGKVDSSPVLCKDKVVFGSYDGRVYLLNTADGKLLWEKDLGKPLIAAPAVSGKSLLVSSTDGTLYVFR
jgi:eukaryotic-like serine/threonine-protein kinase